MKRLPANPKQRLRRLRRQIERLPPYPALLVLVVPLAVVEPLKLATIFIAGEGHWITGGVVMLFSYAVSLFVTHWLFVVVKPKLISLPWFARAWRWFVAVRDKTWRWVGETCGPISPLGKVKNPNTRGQTRGRGELGPLSGTKRGHDAAIRSFRASTTPLPLPRGRYGHIVRGGPSCFRPVARPTPGARYTAMPQ
jgi:hypothetical protein